MYLIVYTYTQILTLISDYFFKVSVSANIVSKDTLEAYLVHPSY